jgi:rubrerythrin
LLLVVASFACLSFLEDEAFQLYELMLKKAEDTETSLLLDTVLQETLKHRELMKHLSTVFERDSVQGAIECEKRMGQFFTQSLQLVRSVRDEVQRGISIAKAARKLMALEESLSEEYSAEMYVKAELLLQTNQVVKKILEGIARDERGHIEILQLITEISSKEQSASDSII